MIGVARVEIEGLTKHIVVEYNYLEHTSSGTMNECLGIDMTVGYTGFAEAHLQPTIRNNKIINSNNIGVNMGSAINGLIENNEIVFTANVLAVGIVGGNHTGGGEDSDDHGT